MADRITSGEKSEIKGIVDETLEKLRALDADAKRHPRDAKKGRDYNRGVLGKSRKFGAKEHAAEYMRQLAGDKSLTNPANFVDALVRKSSTRDRRLLSRYRASVKLALLNHVKPQGLKAFLAAHGGYKGCAKKYQELRRRGRGE